MQAINLALGNKGSMMIAQQENIEWTIVNKADKKKDKFTEMLGVFLIF